MKSGSKDMSRLKVGYFFRHLFFRRNSLLAPVSTHNGSLVAPCSQLQPPKNRVQSLWAGKESSMNLAGRAFTYIGLLVQGYFRCSPWVAYVRTDYRDSATNESHLSSFFVSFASYPAGNPPDYAVRYLIRNFYLGFRTAITSSD
jgi:hypothetical protein